MRKWTNLIAAFGVLVFTAACIGPGGSSAGDRRAAVLEMRSQTLADLYHMAPQARDEINRADGYAVFSNIGVNLILASFGSGYGVLQDNHSGDRIFMRMVSGGLGFGLGVKDFRGIFVFTNRGAMRQFVDYGWDASAQADAAVIAGDLGIAYAGAIDVAPGIKLYQITENGLALQATIQGTKYWRDNDLTSSSATLTRN